VQRSQAISNQVPTRALWSVGEDIQANAALSQAALTALAILSPTLPRGEKPQLDEDVARAARLDPMATQRTLDMLQDISGRFERALVQADWQAELERTLVEAAAKLPATEPGDAGFQREAG
jgi:hypothetical protein